MADAVLHVFVQKIRTATSRSPCGSAADGELLARFAASRDEAAFAALVGRHGCLVRNVCRNVLRDEGDVEEATQATFLLLAHRAGSLRDPEALAGWLHGVARRTALCARRTAARRRAAERRASCGMVVPAPDPSVEASWRELQALLDEELERLPAKLRTPFVLCCLEGYGHKEAAQRLDWKAGTVSGRLDVARKLLRRRLARRGVSLSAVLCGLAVAGNARAGSSSAFVSETAAAAVRFVGVRAAVAGPAARLAGEMLQGTLTGRIRTVVLLFFVVGVLSAGVGSVLLAQQVPAAEPEFVALAAPAAPRTAEAAPPPRLDRYGDTLPDRAIVRLGTKRFVHSFLTDSVVWSPDGKVLATTGGNSTGRQLVLWDAATGRELHDLPAEEAVMAAAFSPDGKSLAATDPRGALLWDVVTGKEVARFEARSSAWAVAFSPDGKTLAVADKNNVIQLWDVAAGHAVGQIKGAEKEPVSLVFSPDGQTLAGATVQGTVRVWELGGKELWQHVLPRIKTRKGVALAFAPGGKVLAGIASDLTVRLWDPRDGRELRTFGDEAEGLLPGDGPYSPAALAYSPDGKSLLTPGRGATLVLWDPATGREIRRWHSGLAQVRSVQFAPDARTVASGGFFGSTVRLWDPATGEERLPAPGHRGSVVSITLAPDGKTLWSLAEDKSLIRWDVASASGKRFFGGPMAGGKFGDQTAVSSDKRLIATGDYVDGDIRLWDNEGHQLATVGRHDGGIVRVLFSPDDKLLATVGRRGGVCMWDVATRKELSRLESAPTDLGGLLAFSPDSRRLIASGFGPIGPRTSKPRVIDVATGKELFFLDTDRTRNAAVFSLDGRLLATSGDFSHPLVEIWDAETGKQLGHWDVPGRGWPSLAFSPDGRYLATGGSERESPLRLWEIATRQEVVCFRGHHSGIGALAFTSDGRTLASGASDATILVWDLTGYAIPDGNRPETLSPARLEECWADLLSPDAAKPYRAIRTLAADPGRAVPFLAKRAQPAQPVDAARLDRLVAALDAETFREREKAEAELTESGLAAAEPALQKLRDGSGPAEGKRRAGALLERLAAERLRLRRALTALEYCNTPDARRALEVLANGAPEAQQTSEARAALTRLRQLTDRP
jgi:RNA polymerase sigma factor (sigma-70 family)